MGKVISLLNQKGGVAKTTSAINLAGALSRIGKKVLLMDLDPQGNASIGVGVEISQEMNTTYELLLKKASIQECIISCSGGYSVIGTDIRLATAELDIVSKFARESLLKTKLESARGMYDYILIDCPPSLGLLTVNALVACDEVLIPVSSSTFALTGLDQLLDSMEHVRSLNPNIEVAGIFLTKFDKRKNFSFEVVDYVKDLFGDKMMQNNIRVCAEIDKAQSNGMDIFKYCELSKRNARSAEDYMALAKELVGRV